MSTVNVTSEFVTVAPFFPNSFVFWEQTGSETVKATIVSSPGAWTRYKNGLFLGIPSRDSWTVVEPATLTAHKTLEEAREHLTKVCAHTVIELQ